MSDHRNNQASGPFEQGFTLLELMVTVAVIAIIAGLAAPSFSRMLARSRLTAGANELVAALQGARMEAIRTNAKVTLCPSTDGSSCSGSNWMRLIMFSSKGGTTTVLRDIQLNGATMTATASPNVTVATPNQIWFLADGFVRTGDPTAPTQVATLGVCSSRLSSENARDVQISMGRTAVSVATRAGCTDPGN